jgi:Xaa-Pro aminopeptidase
MTRVEQLAASLPQHIDSALIMDKINRRYITGFNSSQGMVLITRRNAYFLTDSRYIEAARNTIKGIECVEYKNKETLKALVDSHGLRHIAVEDESLSCAQYRRLKETLNNAELYTDIIEQLIRRMRLIKTPFEIEKIRQAQQLIDYGFNFILTRIKKGRSERELAIELEFAIRKQGAQAAAFDFIVLSGENTSMPHGVPGDRTIKNGDFLLMDFGAVVDGWCSDMTRTVAIGTCSDEQRNVYQTVLTAQLAALSALRAGLSCADGDAAARNVIKAAGYGEFFGHGTGHGVGLEVHEAPRLSLSATETLCEGSVVTVEPGIYFPGRFSVRIEDMVCITKDGCENLTKSPKELITV